MPKNKLRILKCPACSAPLHIKKSFRKNIKSMGRISHIDDTTCGVCGTQCEVICLRKRKSRGVIATDFGDNEEQFWAGFFGGKL